MQLLLAWLKQLVFVIFIASLIDHLLPSSKLQRYVKMVLRLVVFLTLLSPFYRLLHMSSSIQVDLQSQLKEGSIQSTSLSQIIQHGEALKVNREQQTIGWLETHLEQQIRQQLSKTANRNVLQVHVQMAHTKNKEVSLKAISVVLGSKTTVGPIADISIQLHTVGGANHDSKSLQECKRWQQWLKQTWGQSETSVSVKISE